MREGLPDADNCGTFFVMKAERAVFLCFAIAACAGKDAPEKTGETGGTLVISTTAEPNSLFPPAVNGVQGRQISEQIYDYLADVGAGLNTIGDDGFRPLLAQSWAWSADSLAISFKLNPNARWHDGERVTAADVRFTHRLYRDPALSSPMRKQLSAIDSVTAPDSLTTVFWFHERSAQQFLNAAAQVPILPAHIVGRTPADSLRSRPPPPVGSGRFRFVRWEKGQSIELAADSANYRGRPKLDRVIWNTAPDFNTASIRFFAGTADVFEPLRPESLTELRRHPDLRAITLPATALVFLQLNLRDAAGRARPHPLFADRTLRRALSMAIDRASLVRSLFDTLAAVPIGPVVRAFPTTDTSIMQIPFDAARASAALDSLGWKARNGDGYRMRNGRELAFTVLVPVSSMSRTRMAVLLQDQLRRAGIRATIEQMDFAAFTARLSSRRFDAALSALQFGSSPDGTRDAWSTASSRARTGMNYGSYESEAFDAALDTAISARNLATARRYYTVAYQVILSDAPAVWLYEPKMVIGVHKRFRTGVMRADGWWTDLGSWEIPQELRIDRDKLASRR